MMPAAWNLPFILGNDICRVARIRRILRGRRGPQFVRRILRTEEIQHSTTAGILRCILNQEAHNAQSLPRRIEEEAEPALSRDAISFTRAVEFMAGRFAAKEAVIKAHPHRRLTFQSITILRMALRTSAPESKDTFEQTQEPALDQEKEILQDTPVPRSGPLVALIEAEDAHGDGSYASISISHDTDYATAVCLGINPESSLMLKSPRDT
ncbi:hypothetical protein HD806DRAFT_168868 [Xylariaceae sp. AK1471]|nr:hypothetical protein HD806DRAFT_168868 [Xylariaceae sp. AK1471]